MFNIFFKKGEIAENQTLKEFLRYPYDLMDLNKIIIKPKNKNKLKFDPIHFGKFNVREFDENMDVDFFESDYLCFKYKNEQENKKYIGSGISGDTDFKLILFYEDCALTLLNYKIRTPKKIIELTQLQNYALVTKDIYLSRGFIDSNRKDHEGVNLRPIPELDFLEIKKFLFFYFQEYIKKKFPEFEKIVIPYIKIYSNNNNEDKENIEKTYSKIPKSLGWVEEKVYNNICIVNNLK